MRVEGGSNLTHGPQFPIWRGHQNTCALPRSGILLTELFWEGGLLSTRLRECS